MGKRYEFEEATGRDPVDVAAGWTFGLCLFVLALCVLAVSPLAYLWLMGMAGVLISTIGMCAAVHGLTSNGDLIGFVLAGEVIKAGFNVIGAILAGLAKASE